jgi:hypothetical protein
VAQVKLFADPIADELLTQKDHLFLIIAARKAHGKKKSRRNAEAQLRGETVKVTLTKQSKMLMLQ